MALIGGWQRRIDVKRYGRITHASRYSGWRREILAYCQVIIRTTRKDLEAHYGWRLDRLDFFFLDQLEPNALVLQSGDRHAIGLCVGLPFGIVRHLRQAVANPEFLKGYRAPREREDWLWRFLGMMIEHAYLHEVAHAVRGHFEYLKRPNEKRGLDEQSNSLGRYLELDADVHALDMWLAITEASEDFPKSEELLLELHFQRVFTILLLYQVLDLGNRPIRDAQRSRHPSPIHRALLLASAMRATMPGQYGLSALELENAHHQAFSEASIAAESAGLAKDRWWGGKRGHRRGISVYRKYVRRYLDDIEPKLDAFGASLPESLV